MTLFPVLLDTNVLYGSYLNDLILRMAARGFFRPLWSEDILAELDASLARGEADPKRRLALAKRVRAMRRAFPDALVEGYDNLVPAMTCDRKDRHVLAAAVRGNAALLVTFNLRDFPADSLDPYGIEVVHPDQFLMDQLDLHPQETSAVVEQILSDYNEPRLGLEGYCDALVRSGVPEFAALLGAKSGAES